MTDGAMTHVTVPLSMTDGVMTHVTVPLSMSDGAMIHVTVPLWRSESMTDGSYDSCDSATEYEWWSYDSCDCPLWRSQSMTDGVMIHVTVHSGGARIWLMELWLMWLSTLVVPEYDWWSYDSCDCPLWRSRSMTDGAMTHVTVHSGGPRVWLMELWLMWLSTLEVPEYDW